MFNKGEKSLVNEKFNPKFKHLICSKILTAKIKFELLYSLVFKRVDTENENVVKVDIDDLSVVVSDGLEELQELIIWKGMKLAKANDCSSKVKTNEVNLIEVAL